MDQPDAKARTKRIAASRVIIDGVSYTNHVVELTDGILTAHYPLHGEQPMTEWYSDTLTFQTS